jgi:hypothetical protein
MVGLWDSRWARKCRVCGTHVRGNVCVRGNPVWMHVLKIGNVVDKIAEHVVEKRVRLGILKQGNTVCAQMSSTPCPPCNERSRLTKQPKVTNRI